VRPQRGLSVCTIHGKEEIISSKVFVGNLSYDTTQSELASLFAEVGHVTEVFLPVDRITGRPRGFAFVTFADETSVVAAIERFNGQEFNGRNLRITEAEDRPRTAMGGQPPSRHGGYKKSKPKGSRRNIRGKKRSL
jgi:cold-inducible RNA-binding protein